MTPILLTITIIFALGTLGLLFHRQNLLSALLCLETMLLALFLAFTMFSQALLLPTAAPQALILLAFAACGASTGLSLLVAATRTHASNLLKTLNLLKC